MGDTGRLGRLRGLARDVRAAAKAATSGEPPDPASYAHLPPEQRAKIERNIAAAQAQRAKGEAAQQAAAEVSAAARDDEIVQVPDEVRARLRRRTFTPKGLLYDALLPDELDPDDTRDPRRRAEIAAQERAARAAARAAFEAPDHPGVVRERIAMRGSDQPDAVLAHLQGVGLADRPGSVYSVHRVADRISPNLTPRSESGRVVEWEILREPGDPGGAASATSVSLTTLERTHHWVQRGPGEPVPQDEEVGAALLTHAGIGPERCLGITRLLHLAVQTQEGIQGVEDHVHGVGVLTTDGPAVDAAAHEWREQGPRPLDGAAGGVRVVVLDWGAIAHHVHPAAWRGPILPSPLPWLPSTPEELVDAYLRVVGIRARDCYAAAPVMPGRVRLTSEGGPRQPCADGKVRVRHRCASLVVIAHREDPAHAAGRERWARFQREVLRARLDHPGAGRAEVPGRLGAALDRVTRSDLLPWPLGGAAVSPAPYCWPAG